MPEFVLSRDVVYAAAVYGVTLAGVVGWLFLSRQKLLARSAFNVMCVAVRLGIVFAVLFWACWFASIATWLVFVFVVALIVAGVLVDLPVSGFFGFALLYIVQQFVLGFPARHEWMLGPSSTATISDTSPDQRKDLIGTEGVTISPLRPIGDVKIDGQTYRAKAHNGQMLDAAESVVVASVHHGTLLVRPISSTP